MKALCASRRLADFNLHIDAARVQVKVKLLRFQGAQEFVLFRQLGVDAFKLAQAGRGFLQLAQLVVGGLGAFEVFGD